MCVPKAIGCCRTSGPGAKALDDIVDEAIAWVMDTGDEVSSCVSGDLDVHQKIPAGLRH